MWSRFVTRARLLRALIAFGAILAVHRSDAATTTLLVDSQLDGADAAPGDGTCATTGGSCTLRAAIQEAGFPPNDVLVLVPGGSIA